VERENQDHVLLPRDSSIETIGDTNVQSNMAAIAQIGAEQCGLPLMLFTQVRQHCISHDVLIKSNLWHFRGCVSL
jgi:hypothetical protein